MPRRSKGPTLNDGGQWEIQGSQSRRRFHEVLPKGRTKKDAIERERIIRQGYYDEAKLGVKADYPISASVLRWVARKHRSRKKAENHAAKLASYILGRTMSEVVQVANEIKRHKSWSNATKNRRIAILKTSARADYIEGLIEAPLWDRIIMLPERREVPARAYSRDELAALLRGVRKGRKGHQAREIARALYAELYTGLRSSELLALEPKDFTGDCVMLWNTKNGKVRAVPVPGWAAWAFRRLPITVHASTLSHVVRKHLGGRNHWIRHTCGSWMLNAGESIEIVSKILGHSSVTVTSAIYSHILTDSMKEVSTRGLRKKTPRLSPVPQKGSDEKAA